MSSKPPILVRAGRRLLASVASVFGLIVFTFIFLRFLPGGPFDEEVPLLPAVKNSLLQDYGLQGPLWQQLSSYFQQLLSGNLGASSLHSGRPVTRVILEAMPKTLFLGLSSFLLAVIFGWGLAIASYLLRTQSRGRKFWQGVHWILLSVPTLFLGPVLILIFSLWLGWLPATADGRWWGYFLPLVVLTVRPCANFARLLGAALRETLAEPWVLTATAYGLSPQKLLFKFAMKPSFVPLLSSMGSSLAGILSGSLLVENLFNIQGMGTLFLQSLLSRDYFLVTALTLVYGTLLILNHFVFDFLLESLDPRTEVL